MKKILILTLMIIILSSFAIAVTQNPKNFYVNSVSQYGASCGGGATQDPHPKIMNNIEDDATAYCNIGGAELYINFSQHLTFPENTWNISLGNINCDTLGNWTSYDIYIRQGIEWVNVVTDGTTNECTSNSHFGLNTPEFTAKEILINVTDVASQMKISEIYFLSESVLRCPEPQIWCDTFGYTSSLYTTKEWSVSNHDESFNYVFSPRNNQLELDRATDVFRVGYYGLGAFTTNYSIGEGERVLSSRFAPVMSIEFDINITTQGGATDNIDFKTLDTGGASCFTVEFTNESINVVAEVTTEINITPDYNGNFKFISYFGDQNKEYPFNTSTTLNFLDVYFAGAKINSGQLLFNDACTNIMTAVIERPTTGYNITIDNYFHYVGTDLTQSNIDNFYTPIYDPVGEAEATESDDLVEVVTDFWGDFGLNTSGSKTLFGLAVLFFTTIFIIGAFIVSKVEVNFKAVFFLDFILALLLVFIGLFPAWILILIALIGAGLTFFVVRANMT